MSPIDKRTQRVRPPSRYINHGSVDLGLNHHTTYDTYLEIDSDASVCFVSVHSNELINFRVLKPSHFRYFFANIDTLLARNTILFVVAIFTAATKFAHFSFTVFVVAFKHVSVYQEHFHSRILFNCTVNCSLSV